MITFEINNGGTLQIEQDKPGGTLRVTSIDSKGEIYRQDKIAPGDVVMLFNLYRYVKDYDIKNDFINPGGHLASIDDRVL